MDDFDREIKTEFINEALMNLEEAEGAFMELESTPDPKPLLDRIFRLAHNLKGGSRAVGFGDVAEFTHELENLVLQIQKGNIFLSSAVVTTLLKSNDRLIEMLSELKGDLEAKFQNGDLINEIKLRMTAKEEVGAESPQEPHLQEAPSAPSEPIAETQVASSEKERAPADEPEFVVPGADAFFQEATPEPVSKGPEAVSVVQSGPIQKEPVHDAGSPVSPSGSKKTNDGKKEDEVVRVNMSRIDLLNDYVGELIVLQSVLQQQAGSGVSAQMRSSIMQMVKLSKDIQNVSMGLRMLPVKPLIQKLQRVVRDTSQALGKEVQLDVIGEQLDIDKSVLDRLADPLIHILRNGVDHGIEMPEDRVAAGKNRCGRITLSFSNEGNHLVVEAKDDGKGINTEILRTKGIEKGLISTSQSMSEKQLINLIFHPGFSTKAQTSEISGRGVGMDVVKTNVEKIGGQVDVTTVLGQGSVFRLQISLSLAVIEGLVVSTEQNRFVVPINQIQETVNLRSYKVFNGKLGIGACFELRGEVVPILSLDDVLGSKKSRTETEPPTTAVIVTVRDQLVALAIKDILRAQQIVVKPLGNGISTQKGWIGSCVLGDGLPTLILSPVDLLDGKIESNHQENLTRSAA